MPAKPEKVVPNPVIEVLNQARAAELAAILQYMSYHYELVDGDYGKFAADLKLIAIDEMRHAEMLAERVLFLGGIPTSRPMVETRKKQPVLAVMQHGMAEEAKAIADYNRFYQTCMAAHDKKSASIFETLINEEQVHLEHFQNIARHIEELGSAYLATQTGGPAEAGVAARGFVAAKAGGPAA